MMEAVRTSETSVYCTETTRLYITEAYHIHTRHRENLKSHKLAIYVIATLHKFCSLTYGGLVI